VVIVIAVLRNLSGKMTCERARIRQPVRVFVIGANTWLKSAVAPEADKPTSACYGVFGSGHGEERMQVQISLAQHDDVAPWLRLADEVVPLFGPMPGFDDVLIRKIAQRLAYCARTDAGDGCFLGGVIIGGSGTEYAIRWLAVSTNFQRLGIGKLLVEAAISTTPPKSTIHVDTFVADSPGAGAARRLYERCGFIPGGIWREGEVVRQRYVRRPYNVPR
jgi:GNAT superfamily N-acetyltransferase